MCKNKTVMVIYYVAFCVAFYVFYCIMYWSLKGVPCLPFKFPFMSPFYLIDGLRVVTKTDMIKHYQEMKSKGYEYAGIMTSIRSVLIVKDRKLINDVLIKNKDRFDENDFHYRNRYELGDINRADLDGTNWKEMMLMLNPNILSSDQSSLLTSILNIIPYLVEAIEDCVLEDRDFDVKELFACFTADVIIYHCYKVNCRSYKRSRSGFCQCQSDRLSSLGLTTPEESVSSWLYSKTREFMKYREASDYKHIDCSSVTSSIEEWSKTQKEPVVGYKTIGKTCLFFYHSFDTSATTLTFALYELSRNQNVQEKVRKEINDVLDKRNDVISWESLRDMKYLDRVIYETLRLYPPSPNLIQSCHNGYKLGNTDVKISFTTDVVIPLFSLHRDPDYFVDAERFEPERFNEDNKARNPPFYMPYGEGPIECESIQSCTIQTKIGLVYILRSFRLKLSGKTHMPLRLHPQTFLKCYDTLYIKAEKI